ncbi:disulfide bond formation protein DsbA [Actinoplanes sp. TRM 88003]|uniref:Disulfide bond formation protein DsbA n=1 Tax=Paractinoplanes aksuensis TaxID=2939490 RepID=A0ABT1DV47_9ACTN|nr:disulfide bond formation protein DsbA [Actinoplanes aksuensis]MCO8273835.1 disulfide bond formation protein DsbA [Actinoplanes aksuensis]
MTDINFYFDPICPFAWMTSKWIRIVQRQRDYSVDWRFISLRLINAHIDYDSHFPPEYEAQHTAGLRLLRMASAVREQHGREAIGPLYAAFGARILESGPDAGREPGWQGTPELAASSLAEAGLPATLVEHLDDTSRDAEIQAESDEALALTGKDVGTPIVHFEPPHGVAFFGPVISRLPDEEQAAELWDHVVGLARFPGFAELKRSLREQPQLPSFGVTTDGTGKVEDWHAGSRRLKK